MLKKRKRQRRRLIGAVAALGVLLGLMLRMLPEEAAAEGREASVTVRFHGLTYTADARRETVGALLARLGLSPEDGDTLSCPVDTPVQEGMTVSVDQHCQQREICTLVLPAQTVYTRELSLPLGAEKVVFPGQDGELRCTVDADYVNGICVGKRYAAQEIITEVQDRVVAVGVQETAADDFQISGGYIRLPTGEPITYTRTAAMTASAYTHTDLFRSKVTALGTPVHLGTVAVDPARIPLGTRMLIAASDGSWFYGLARAEDTLVGTEGTDLALYFPTTAQCMDFSPRTCTVYFLG